MTIETTEINSKVKTEKELKKEAAKAEKLAKFEEKQKKLAAIKANATKKDSKKIKNLNVIVYEGKTKLGEKKDVTNEIPNVYSPRYVEAAWYEWWEKEGFFTPEYAQNSNNPNSKETFTIIIPPPNVTGTLHLGHALATSIEDTITRWHRMNGKTVLYNPGCDHAGIATQVVVEKKLQKEKNVSRHDLGRKNFIDEVWKWKNEKGVQIYEQLKKIGASVDWNRAAFTMDPKMIKAAKEAFIQLYNKKKIYRSTRLVNWSCALRSAISDIEVEKKELKGRTALFVPGYKEKIEFGLLISFAYLVEDSDEEIVVATTRLETMLGDVAIAVHPNDQRYKHLIGKKCKHPFLNRFLPIISDSFVDISFGTGAVKITPAHDHNDYEVGVRHNLSFISVISDNGEMLNNCGKFSGLKRFDARKKLMEDLKELNLFRNVIENPMVVPICSRSKDIIEPIIKCQWYVSCKEMAEKALNAVKIGDLKIIPDFFVNTWNKWLEEIRDWCISRQLWWGIQIPAYYVTINDSTILSSNLNDSDYWVAALDAESAVKQASQKFGVSQDKISIKQDEDVLDTWFSSALWPFSLMGWPEKTPDMERFFPGNLLETGHDILFFWVVRMVFLSQELCGKLPFNEVYLHAIIRDAHGRKMSKSLGNVIDPLDVISGISLSNLQLKLELGNLDANELKIAKEGQAKDYPMGIPECGTDALRFALMAYTGQGRDINLDVLRVHGYRCFCNKIWQGIRFVLTQLGPNFQPLNNNLNINEVESVIDKWILLRLSKCISSCKNGFIKYNFQEITSALFNFWIYEFCDVYLEVVKLFFYSDEKQTEDKKKILKMRQILFTCVDSFLRLISPFMPFLSEELWQRFPKKKDEKAKSICVAEYPNSEDYDYNDSKIDALISNGLELITNIRSLRTENNILPKQKANLFIVVAAEEQIEEFKKIETLFIALASSNLVTFYTENLQNNVPSNCVQTNTNLKNIKAFVQLQQ